MLKYKAGLLLYRYNKSASEYEYFMVKPNKRSYLNKYWEIPKGSMESGETPIKTAIREFTEECYYYNDLTENCFQEEINLMINKILRVNSFIYKSLFDDFNTEWIKIYAIIDNRTTTEEKSIPYRSRIYQNKKENITYPEIIGWSYFPFSDIINNNFDIIPPHKKIIIEINNELTKNFYKKDKIKSFNKF